MLRGLGLFMHDFVGTSPCVSFWDTLYSFCPSLSVFSPFYFLKSLQRCEVIMLSREACYSLFSLSFLYFWWSSWRNDSCKVVHREYILKIGYAGWTSQNGHSFLCWSPVCIIMCTHGSIYYLGIENCTKTIQYIFIYLLTACFLGKVFRVWQGWEQRVLLVVCLNVVPK